MSRAKVIDVLNCLLSIQRFSVVSYINETQPRTHPGNEVLVEATRAIAADHEYYSQRLVEAIEDRHGSVNSGSFPMRFMSLNDLALDYLLDRLIENHQRNIQVNERCVAKLVEDPQAWSLATEILGSERAHLDILMEFLPQIEPTPSDDEIHLQVA